MLQFHRRNASQKDVENVHAFIALRLKAGDRNWTAAEVYCLAG